MNKFPARRKREETKSWNIEPVLDFFVFRGFDQVFCLRKLKIFSAKVCQVGMKILDEQHFSGVLEIINCQVVFKVSGKPWKNLENALGWLFSTKMKENVLQLLLLTI